ncbi:MAG TPA: T9SS type A sorting domain-containing protein [Chitinophagales bacterium]|nr:T9SS type A sorting domain-containing protein [Chitinophagales bacterium]
MWEDATNITSEGSDKFKIFPNPVNDILFITMTNTNDISEINVLDFYGNVVMHFTGNRNSIDVSHLPSGNYLLQLFTKNEISSIYFIH